MAITLVTYAEQNVLPEYDASLHDAMGGLNGIISGAEVTVVNNGLHIAAGDGILAGRYFIIDEEQISVSLPASGSVASALYIHMDLTDADTPIEIIAGPVPTYVYDRANGVYDLRLATFTATPSGISSLTDVAPKINPKRIIQRNTAYSVGEIVQCPSAPAGVMLLCITGGTTAAVEPDFNVPGSSLAFDGSVTWRAFKPSPPEVTSGETVNASGPIDMITLPRGEYLITAQMLFGLPSGGGQYGASIYKSDVDEVAYVTGYDTVSKNASAYVSFALSLAQNETLSLRKHGTPVPNSVTCRWSIIKFA